MSRDFPALVDVWSLARGRQGFSGTWPLSRMQRLADLLHSTEGEVRFEIQFDHDATGQAMADLVVYAELRLLCQRDLEPFAYRVERRTRLGLIRHEDEEASLAAGMEPCLVPGEAMSLTEMVEDELILAVPLVPKRSSEPLGHRIGECATGDDPGDREAPEEQTRKPFAELASLLRGEDDND